MTTEDELRDQVADLETRLSSMVSQRDMTILSLRKRVRDLELSHGMVALKESKLRGQLETIRGLVAQARIEEALVLIRDFQP